MLIAIALLIVAILMLVFRNQGNVETVQPQPEVNEEEIVATAIAGLSLTQTALPQPTLPPTNTPLPTATSTATPLPPTETPVPPTEVPTEAPTETTAPIETEVPADIDASEALTDTTETVDLDLSESVTETVGITSDTPLTTTLPAVDPAVCVAGPLVADNGCTYDVEIGFSVFNPDTGIHDFYLSNTGTCDIPANHKLVQVTDGLTTKTFETEYTIGGEFFSVGAVPDPNYVENGTDEPPFVFLNFFIPEDSGTYESCWRLTDENDNFYGAPLTTTVVVE